MTKLLIAVIPIVILIAILYAIVQLMDRRKESEEQADELLPYYARQSLLSDAERNFYGVLALALPQAGLGDAVIMSKVRLEDVLGVKKGLNASQRATARNRIMSKHVDFVVCIGAELRPTIAIELDDATHANADAAERDAFKDRAFAAAGVPLVRVRARKAYVVEEVAACLRGS